MQDVINEFAYRYPHAFGGVIADLADLADIAKILLYYI